MAEFRVVRLFRYPVKSLLGEEVRDVDVSFEGFDGDRLFAVVDTGTGLALSAKGEPRLLTVGARLVHGELELIFPEGAVRENYDERLTNFLQRPVRLLRNNGTSLSFRGLEIDFEKGAVYEKTGETRETRFHDSMPIHLINLRSLEKMGLSLDDAARFRPNIVFSAEQDDETLVGGYLQAGDAVLKIVKPTRRCIVITHQQKNLGRNLELLRTLRANSEGKFGLYATVVKPGKISVDDRLRFYPAETHHTT
ncbi:MAG: MOSC N-terminal beta barrel domain-containing protein [Candidatus Caldarchaeum sp.]